MLKTQLNGKNLLVPNVTSLDIQGFVIGKPPVLHSVFMCMGASIPALMVVLPGWAWATTPAQSPPGAPANIHTRQLAIDSRSGLMSGSLGTRSGRKQICIACAFNTHSSALASKQMSADVLLILLS